MFDATPPDLTGSIAGERQQGSACAPVPVRWAGQVAVQYHMSLAGTGTSVNEDRAGRGDGRFLGRRIRLRSQQPPISDGEAM